MLLFRCEELKTADLARLQAFFEANPEYHLAVNGEPPKANEAQEAFDFLPPADWPFERKWLLAFLAEDGSMIGMASLLAGLFANGVWHIGLFIVATALHGTGAAEHLYRQLESWMRERGALWSRLGVVAGNGRAERFWEKMGYVEVRKRNGVAMGKRVSDLRVMVKALADGNLPQYLALVARDRPD
jgi:GNAT superfamily N-acetyltransferase